MRESSKKSKIVKIQLSFLTHQVYMAKFNFLVKSLMRIPHEVEKWGLAFYAMSWKVPDTKGKKCVKHNDQSLIVIF